MKYDDQQRAERYSFISDRLKKGFSSLDIRRQFAAHFQMTVDAARYWYDEALKYLAEEVPPLLRRSNHAVALEFYHDQIVGYQSDLMAIQKEIDRIDAAIKRRELIVAELDGLPSSDREDALENLKLIPAYTSVDKINALESKSRVRDRLMRAASELFILNGAKAFSQNDWRVSLSVLLDNNLIKPPEAERMLRVIKVLEQQRESAKSATLLEATAIDDRFKGLEDIEI